MFTLFRGLGSSEEEGLSRPVAASLRGLWETSVWRAGGAPAVSGVDNELQVLQWVV